MKNAEFFSPCRKAKLSFGFTLAEVLITLGIIGIVAAITIPSLVQKYKVMVLRNQFKVADAFLQEALQKSVTELGYINANEFMPQQNVSSEGIIDFQNTVEQLNEIWLKQFKIIKKFSVNELLYKKDYICHAVSDNSKLSFTNCPMIEFGDVFLLSNGILVTRMYEMHSAHGYLRIAYTFDTNGLKGPNRHGYDIFSYRSIEHIKMCNSTLPGNYSSLGCYYFASKNINPVYDDKDYWDILYKPKSYFEKK
ncbi:prepilin-type N-terminal cleavage/methylation domain-containing protein [bacterium]|nr:prepilin-type N-terminal cleavage/methylation domain-containing protein [bacterium]